METALSLAQVAKLMSVATSTIHALIRESDHSKRIPHVRVGKSYRFFASDLARFFKVDIGIIEKFMNKEEA